MSSARVTLDNPVFAGRLRDFSRGTPFVHQPKSQPKPAHRGISDVFAQPTLQRTFTAVAPAKPRMDKSEVLLRNATTKPQVKKKRGSATITQKAMVAMALIVFISGIGVAALGLKTNKHVEAQVQAVTQSTESSNNASTDEETPNEVKPDSKAMTGHMVAPDQPRYIRISKLGVFARVSSQGLDKSGALKAPSNVFNAGWYDQSAKPGQPGAMLLDGHVSGPTQRGVFFNLKKLTAGDTLEIERGDGQKFNYTVVQSQTYDASNTDMQKAMNPIVKGKPGINLITCAGKYDPKTKEYPQRIIVFATQN
jgi:LPXTG-site transpeptidase (sortase) family protein